MKRSFIILSALVLLSVAVWTAVQVGSSPSETQGPGSKSLATSADHEGKRQQRKESPAPALIRKLSDPSLHRADRIAAIRALPSDLSPEEYQALVDLLRQPAPERIGVSTWYMILNEIMEVLREPRFSWSGYVDALGMLMCDRHVDSVVRDYSAQHLALYLAAEGQAHQPGSFEKGMESFVTVLKGEREAHEEVTGTILMALADLKGKRPAEDFQPYDRSLELLISDFVTGVRSTSRANRISAIQASGRMDYRGVLPAIRGLAMDLALDPSLRLSSVAALGYFSDPEDRPFLQELARGEDRLRFAAATALRNFDQ